MTKNEVLNFFKKVNLAERYVDLCDKFSNYENAKSPKKSEVSGILKVLGLDFEFSKPDSSFFEDINVSGYNFRFMLGYKSGLISSFYMLWSDEETVLRAEPAEIIDDLGIDFFGKTEYRYPISTSNEDLEEILDEILDVYKAFKKEFIKQYG